MTEIEKSAFFRDLTGTPDFPEAEVVADIYLCPGCGMSVVDDWYPAPTGDTWHRECFAESWRPQFTEDEPEEGQ